MKGLFFFLITPALCAVCEPSTVTQTVTVTTCLSAVKNAGEFYEKPTSSSHSPPGPTTVVPIVSNEQYTPDEPTLPAPTTLQTAVSTSQATVPPENTPSQPAEPAPSPPDNNNNPPGDYKSGSSGSVYNPLPPHAVVNYASPPNFNTLVNQPGLAVIKNSCKYDIIFSSVGCGEGTTDHTIAAGEEFTEPTRVCPLNENNVTTGGIQLRAMMPGVTEFKPMLLEYTDNAFGLTSYDLSFLDCMEKGTTDLSPCAGWDGGHQCGSAQGCPVMACLPGEYCDLSSYTVPEYGLTGDNQKAREDFGAPVGACDSSKGIVWELCAGNGKGGGGY